MRRARRTDGVTDREPPRPITCARPECSRQAAVRLVIDVGRRIVSMDLLVDEVGGAASLCSIHAEKVIPPRDWTLEDHREMVPRLFKVSQPVGATSDETRSVAPKSKVRRSTDSVFDAEKALAHDVAVEVDPVPELGAEPSNGQLSFEAQPYDFPPEYSLRKTVKEPEPDKDPEPDSTGSPLLARAFDAGRSRRTPSHLTPKPGNPAGPASPATPE